MVVSISRLVQQPDPRNRLHGLRQCMHRYLVSSLAEIWHTFDDSIHAHLITYQHNEAGGPTFSHPASLSINRILKKTTSAIGRLRLRLRLSKQKPVRHLTLTSTEAFYICCGLDIEIVYGRFQPEKALSVRLLRLFHKC